MSEANNQNIELPKVVIVIPNHNYKHWLNDAIKSVAIQDYPNKELVIVDDGSDDDSWEFLQKRELYTIGHIKSMLVKPIEDVIKFRYWADKQNSIECTAIKLDQAGGPSRARNIGINYTFGDTHIFGFLDADDYWLQGKISKSVAEFIKNPQMIGAVYTDNYALNIHTETMIREYRRSYDRAELFSNNMVHSGSFVSRLAFSKVGLYDEEMRTAEDWDLWIRISENFLIHHIPEALVVARNGNYNSTNSVPKEIWQKNWQRISEKIQKRIGNNGQKS